VALKEAGIWIEVTTLIVPGMNDSPEELKDIAEFIARKLGVEVPWHVTRFYGQYKMSETPSTELGTLEEAFRIGQEAGLRYVYCGNVPGRADENTYCPDCGEIVIERTGYAIGDIRLSEEGACRHCGRRIEGLWK
jgi:pyruvate formate lyase activating enzyme